MAFLDRLRFTLKDWLEQTHSVGWFLNCTFLSAKYVCVPDPTSVFPESQIVVTVQVPNPYVYIPPKTHEVMSYWDLIDMLKQNGRYISANLLQAALCNMNDSLLHFTVHELLPTAKCSWFFLRVPVADWQDFVAEEYDRGRDA